ncbi:hypothetical protein RU639_002470 [Aspergillus parasiticus]
MAQALCLGSPFKTPIKAEKDLDRDNVRPQSSKLVASDSITDTREVADPSNHLSSGISAVRPVRSEERFRTPQCQMKMFNVQEKLEMSGARYGDCSGPEPIRRTARQEETSPLVRKALRQSNPPNQGIMSKVKRKLQFTAGSRSKKRVLASNTFVRRKSSTTKTTNWWDM